MGCNCSGRGRNVRDQVTRSGGSGSNGDDGSSRKQWRRASARSGSSGNGPRLKRKERWRNGPMRRWKRWQRKPQSESERGDGNGGQSAREGWQWPKQKQWRRASAGRGARALTVANAETGARALTVADAERRKAVARRADAATEARGGKGPVLERRYVEGRLSSRLQSNRLSSRLHSGSDGDNGRPRHRGKGDDGVDQRRRGRRCGRSSEGATLRSIIAVAMGIANSQSRHQWHPSGR